MHETTASGREIAPWVTRKKTVPEANQIHRKLMLLWDIAEHCDGLTWKSPATREEVAQQYIAADHLMEEVYHLWQQVKQSVETTAVAH